MYPKHCKSENPGGKGKAEEVGILRELFMRGFNHVAPTNHALAYRDQLRSGDECMINVCFDADIVQSTIFPMRYTQRI